MGGLLSRLRKSLVPVARGGKSVTVGRNRADPRLRPAFPENMSESEIRDHLREWIVSHAKSKPAAGDVTDQTHLLETGLLSSLDIVEFVLFIEELRGDEVDTDEIEPEVFTSIDTLYDSFFRPLAA